MSKIYSFKDIVELQKLPLERKIGIAKTAIYTGYQASISRPAIAFSGGKDSTVLWHLIKTYFPHEHENTVIIFGNTGVEYPESLKFARELGKTWGGERFYEATPERLVKDGLKYAAQRRVLEYLIESGEIGNVLKADGKLKTTQSLEKACPPILLEQFRRDGLIWPAGMPKSYWWCVDQYGYPILGKAASKLKARRINIDCFLLFSETATDKDELKQYYNVLRNVKISQACCDILKKEPSEKIQAEFKVDLIFKGLMAAESHNRKTNFSTRGYLFESKRKYLDTPFYHCNPLSIWTDNDIWEYIHRFNVPYSPLYDMTYRNDKGETCRMKRNGCVGCYTDYGRKNSHMYVLRQTHPGRWRAVMNYGMAREIQRLRTCGSDAYKPSKKDYSRLAILGAMPTASGDDYNERLAWAVENRPCAFD